ncbi:WD40 repeat domain-containing protein [Micromonospora parva]|uniref:WD40 repeat domain-containing protein n=1 Tax=Micromonospora parva TaxID=1464048 RepID=UPI0033FC4376
MRGNGPEGPWGELVTVIMDRYDALPPLRRIRPEVEEAAAVLARTGFVRAANDLPRDGLAASVKAAIREWSPNPRRLVVYWAGHGKAVHGGEFFLCCRDTTGPEPAQETAMSARRLGELLATKDVAEIVVLVDACGAGGAADEIVDGFRRQAERRVAAGGGRPNIAVISSASRFEMAKERVFSRALAEVLRDGPPPDPSYLPWTDRDRHITPNELAQALRVKLASIGAGRILQTPDHDMAGMVGRFFRNPRHRGWLPDVNVDEHRQRNALLPADVVEHFMLKFRGIDAGDDQGWYFTGRRTVLRRIVAWLNDDRPGMLAVTGSPGCGKSAVLGRLAILSVPDYRQEVEIHGGLSGVPVDTIPTAGSIHAGVHAKNKAILDCVNELSEALNITAPSRGWQTASEFVHRVGEVRRHRATILLDALDEAQHRDIRLIASELLRPLAELPGIKVLVATRPDRSRDPVRAEQGHRPLLHALGVSDDQVIWLDRDADQDADIASYSFRRLTHTAGSPYVGRDGEARRAAEEIAAHSNGVFLFARLLTRRLARMPQVADLGSPQMRSLLSGSVVDAFAEDLARFGDHERKVRDLLTPLAWAEGAGLPRRDVWLTLANAVTDGGRYTEADLHWLMANAGAHLVESSEDGQAVYRLYHQSYNDYLRLGTQTRRVQALITRALVGLTTIDGVRRWPDANPYVLRHLATHAAAGDSLPELVDDSGFLLYAEPTRLWRVLAGVDHRDRPLVRLYWRTAADFPDMSTAQRAAALQSVALAHEPEALPLLHPVDEVPWRGLWGRGERSAFHRRLAGHTSAVTAVAIREVSRDVVIATASGDGTVRVWDTTGNHRATLRGHRAPVLAVEIVAVDGRTFVATGGADGTVRLWDLTTGAQEASVSHAGGWVHALAAVNLPDGRALLVGGDEAGSVRIWGLPALSLHATLPDHLTTVRAIVTAQGRDGRCLIVTGGDDGRVRLWDPEGWVLLRTLGTTGWIYALAAATIGGRLLLATGGAFGTVTLWDAGTGESHLSCTGHTGAVNALAFGEIDGRTVLATAGDDGGVRLWDPVSGSALRTLRHPPSVYHAESDWAGEGRRMLALEGPEGPGDEQAPRDDPPADRESILALGFNTGRGPAVLATGGADRTLRLWETVTSTGGATRDDGRFTTSAVFTRIGSEHVLVTGGRDGRVLVWDAVTGRVRQPIVGVGAVNALAVTELGGRPVVAVAAGQSVRLCDAATGDLLDATRGNAVLSVMAVAFCDLGEGVLVAYTGDLGQLVLWSPATHERWTVQTAGGRVNALAVAVQGDRRVVATVGFSDTVELRDLGGEEVQLLAGHKGYVRALAAGTLSGRPVLATGGQDNNVVLWDVERGEKIHTLRGHGEAVNAFAIGEIDGRTVLASGGDDRTVLLWDCRTGQRLAQLTTQTAAVRALAIIERDGRTLLASGGDDGVHMVELRRLPVPPEQGGATGGRRQRVPADGPVFAPEPEPSSMAASPTPPEESEGRRRRTWTPWPRGN